MQMGAGLGVLGVSGYVFLALVGHTLPKDQATAVQSLYFLANIVGPGVFAGLEQETSRSTAASLALGKPLVPVMRRAGNHAAGVLAITLVALLAASPLLVSGALQGYWVLLLETMLAAGFAALVYAVRGLIAGQRRFGGYSVAITTEGLARLIPCALLVVFGGASVWVFGLIFACGQGFATLAGLRWVKPRSAGAEKRVRGPVLPDFQSSADATAGGVAVLVVATLLAQAVANLAPLILSSRLVGDASLAFAFGQAFVLLRIPLLLFAPVQAMLLPGLTVAASAGDVAFVRKRMRLILGAVLLVGTFGTVLCTVFGGWILRVFFAVRTPLSPTILALLGVGTILLMAAYMLQPALVALGLQRRVGISWIVGATVLTALAVLPIAPLHAAILGQLTGPAVIVVMMLLSLRGLSPDDDASTAGPPQHVNQQQ